MTTYQIENSVSGHIFGTYEGDTPEAAIQAMLDDAGHDGPADAEIVATTIQSVILKIKSTADDVNALICEWANCDDADVDDQGDIWISGPQAGHWLNDERKADFIAWCQSH